MRSAYVQTGRTHSTTKIAVLAPLLRRGNFYGIKRMVESNGAGNEILFVVMSPIHYVFNKVTVESVNPTDSASLNQSGFGLARLNIVY